MPEISRFYGTHFHIEYGEYRAVINLSDEVVHGYMPKRALNLVFEWMDIHKEELMDNWNLIQSGAAPQKIKPLK